MQIVKYEKFSDNAVVSARFTLYLSAYEMALVSAVMKYVSENLENLKSIDFPQDVEGMMKKIKFMARDMERRL